MFKSLKEKLSSFFGKPKEEKEKPKPAEAKKIQKPKKEKIPVKKQDEKVKEVPKEIESSLQPSSEAKIQEIIKREEKIPEKIKQIEEKESSGFFKKIFSKKEKKDSVKEKEKEKEEKIESKEVEEIKPAEKPNFISRILLGKSKVSQEDFNKIFDELELILLENNTALEVVDKIKESLSAKIVGKELKKDAVSETITFDLKEAISSVLKNPPDLIEQIKSHSGIFVIIFFGINGSGKTTSIAKLSHLLKKENISSVLAASDTFRAAAIQQLETHADNLKVPIIKHDYGADPTAVAFDAKAYAKKHGIKCVLIDTAGRMYTKENLVKQMEKIIRVIQPDLKIFVGEAITGNDAVEQAKTFNEAVGIDGSILTKSDIDEKGGAILSVSYVTQKPIYFLGIGQGYNDLEIFSKDKILERLGLS